MQLDFCTKYFHDLTKMMSSDAHILQLKWHQFQFRLGLRPHTPQQNRACERSVSGAENGAERAENWLERSGAVSRIQKIKWSVSGAGAGGRWSGNGAVSGQNLPLKIRSTIKPLKVKTSSLSDIHRSPAHRTVPAPTTSRSRSAHPPLDFLNPAHRSAPLIWLFDPLRYSAKPDLRGGQGPRYPANRGSQSPTIPAGFFHFSQARTVHA